MRRLVPLALASMLLAALPAGAADRDRPLAVADTAPDFTLPDQDGKPVRLSDLLATRRYVVVAFYVQAFTPG